MTRPSLLDARSLPEGAIDALGAARHRRARRRALVTGSLALLLVALFVVSLSVGRTVYPLGDVLGVILGQPVPGASFTVGELRLPRAVTGALAGLAFGAAGVVFQTMLRNPLASPDVIGITTGASAAAVWGILALGLSGLAVSTLAAAGALGTAALIYLLSFRGGVRGARLILIGIGTDAILRAVISWLLLRADAWDVPAALRWITGTLNDAFWPGVPPLALAVAVLLPVLLLLGRSLSMLQLGDESATALGVRTERARAVLLLVAVALAAFATAATGPIAFVAFLSGPIAARLAGAGASLPLPAALVGAVLVLSADLLGQYAFGTRFPVGVITGALGAPFLLFLLVRSHRSGGPPLTAARSLLVENATIGYGERIVVDALDLVVPPGRITVIVGANACGKSTLLRTMARLIAPRSGRVLLDGAEIHRMPTKQLARELGLLPQTPIAPEGITVGDLVGRGRHPHQGLFRRWGPDDDAAVAAALEATGVLDLADRPLDELSGGQRQRAWIAMALAQDTDVLLLDEPTTFLDVSHQVEVLDLLTDLNRGRGTTIVLVLHDLNLAARYGDHLVALRNGRLVASGTAHEVVTEEVVREVFGLDCHVIADPTCGAPLVLPLGRHHVG